jgi:hypothetical protein
MKILFPPAIMILLISCTSSRLGSKKFNEQSIPSQFKCSECILLIVERDKGNAINNYIKKSFGKNYSGKFEMATRQEIESNPKYQDSKIYRFILSDKTWTSGGTTAITTVTQTISTGPNNSNASLAGISSSTDFKYNNSYSMDFIIYDRLEEKNYPSIGVSSNVPAKAINRTSVLLNKILTE